MACDIGSERRHVQRYSQAAVQRVAHGGSVTRSTTSSTPTRRPSSAVSDVTPASAMPHGTIAENARRSQSQFSAKPCSVVARDTRTPIAPTLRAGPRLVRWHPHPDRPVDPAGLQPELGAHVDQRLLKAPNEIHHIERLGQPDDRIADQLAGAVPGDLAAAVGVDDGGAVDRALLGQRAAARGVDRRVLEQQQRVGSARHPRVGQLALQLPRRPGSRRCPAAAHRSVWWPTGWTLTISTVLRGVGQRLADRVVVELEARPLERRGDGPLPAEQALVGELAEHRPQRETRAPSAASAGSPHGPAPSVNSELVTGAGPVKFTGPDSSS